MLPHGAVSYTHLFLQSMVDINLDAVSLRILDSSRLIQHIFRQFLESVPAVLQISKHLGVGVIIRIVARLPNLFIFYQQRAIAAQNRCV